MKQLLEQVKFKVNDFEVSCLLGTNGGACTLLFMVSEMFVEFAYSMPKYWLSEQWYFTHRMLIFSKCMDGYNQS